MCALSREQLSLISSVPLDLMLFFCSFAITGREFATILLGVTEYLHRYLGTLAIDDSSYVQLQPEILFLR